ncbi:hypothetical protein RJ641_017128 [Dillenia turbinata]|uniref:Transmembrane protein n=1 Tax=Dillenia turbinata TaxID=194707 RepID=A0AAN8YZB6_9MAGN
MEVPKGFVEKLWRFLSFLPFFLLLVTLGLLKGIIISPVAVGIILVGNSAVIIGLWPAHFLWTCYCVIKTKRLGLLLKIVVLVLLPFPLLLWPVCGIAASLLGAVGYGLVYPLIATFEAVGENAADKYYHCFLDGCLSTLEGSCTVVRDFTDFCFHSYFSYMDELSEKVAVNEKPMDIKLLRLPSCLLASIIGMVVDLLLITAVAIWKSPYMLFKGWKRLLEDLIGREGPFLETVCVPFAGLAIILWPMIVVGAVLGALISSIFLGLYGGVIVHQIPAFQEDSLWMGLVYIISIVSHFDEYINDLLYLREGSCLPRPKYRKCMRNHSVELERTKPKEIDRRDQKNRKGSNNTNLISERSRTLKGTIQQFKSVQVWDWLFKSCEVNGRILLQEGLLDVKDIGECIVKGKCKKLDIKLPAWSILKCLLASAKSNSTGLVILDDTELTRNNGPRDKMFEWFMGPLLIMKEQIKGLHLTESEEGCLRKLIMEGNHERPEDWDGNDFPSTDNVRKAQLQAIIRRLKGIVASMSRMPTYRRRFRNLVKVLYLEAIQASTIGESSNIRYGKNLKESWTERDGNTEEDKYGRPASDDQILV